MATVTAAAAAAVSAARRSSCLFKGCTAVNIAAATATASVAVLSFLLAKSH